VKNQVRKGPLFASALLAFIVALSGSTVMAASYAGHVDGVGNVDVELLSQGKLKFPRRARSYGISGEVTVRFNVDVEGKASAAVIVEAKPRRMFDRSAMRFVETLQFEPYVSDGSAVEVKDVVMTVAYRLE
jgi:protein TonB